MYRFPGYVDYHKENDGIYVTSNLYGNVIRLTDYAVKQEFEDLVEQSGCEKLETPLTNLLHEQGLLLNDTEFNQTMTEIRKLMDDIFRYQYCLLRVAIFGAHIAMKTIILLGCLGRF